MKYLLKIYISLERHCQSLQIRSLITSPAIIKPATDGTNAMLAVIRCPFSSRPDSLGCSLELCGIALIFLRLCASARSA